MKKLAIFLLVIIAVFAIYWFGFRSSRIRDDGPKMTPIALKKHSEQFNGSVDRAIAAYLYVKNAFVEDDTVKVKSGTKTFIALLDSIPLEELKKDTALIFETATSNIRDIRSNAESLLAQTNITEMRHDFSMITQMMYPSFFKTINYEGPILYLQHCPMAFGDDQPASWISDNRQVVNPYLGKRHPEYKATMLHCGSVKDSIIIHQ